VYVHVSREASNCVKNKGDAIVLESLDTCLRSPVVKYDKTPLKFIQYLQSPGPVLSHTLLPSDKTGKFHSSLGATLIAGIGDMRPA